ncbi:prepilin-type N-terminal cleavage/methylation domain-containing protein, partial [Candidatus Sumerlaeota bacterium]|nr:prepilin-type N-terminal cleavage/methylation domain-containing protein [Candidatus Sumerlaeota bacterium]
MKHPRHYFPSRAFSLIELLMVVGIISILASIAVVNYQGSITRAKTSRALADMRTITIGIEAYHVDNNEYPPNPAIAEVPPPAVKGWLPGLNVIPIQITTPIAYLSTRPQDPFRHGAMANFYDNFEPQFTDQQPYFSYYKIISDKDWLRSIDPKHPLASRVVSLIAVDTSESGGVPFLNHGASKKYGEWVMWSAGPDLRLWRAKDDFVVPGDPLNALRP